MTEGLEDWTGRTHDGHTHGSLASAPNGRDNLLVIMMAVLYRCPLSKASDQSQTAPAIPNRARLLRRRICQASSAYINSRPTIHTSQTFVQTRAQSVSSRPDTITAKRNIAATQAFKAVYSGGAMKSRELTERIEQPVFYHARPVLETSLVLAWTIAR